MHNRLRLAALFLSACVASVAVACSGGSGADKAGGSGGPVVLRLANTNGRIDFTPAVERFAQQVEKLSGGDLRVVAVDQFGNSAPDAEQQVVHAVSKGKVDLGWVGTRVFDTLGVKSFQALTAPMLVDSYALENALIERGITKEMLEGVDRLGVVGLGVLPDGLRKPIGVKGPIRGPADWRQISFGTLLSDGQAEAIRALGARPVATQWMEREKKLANGTMQGFETSLWVHQHNAALVPLAPYVTANVNLWPQMDVLLVNPSRFDALSDEQREWLEKAVREAEKVSLAAKDAEALSDSCKAGARFANASADHLAALEAAFAPVYANLERNGETKRYIERIRALKESTAADPALSIRPDCAGRAPQRATTDSGTAPAYLNGTYRFVLTQADADKVGDRDTGYPHVDTIKLENGRLSGGCFGAAGGTYSVRGDRITFHSIEYDEDTTTRLSVDRKGNLHLTPVPPMDPGVAFTCFYKPWTKIDATGGARSAPRSLNGTYRYVLTRADARAEIPRAPDIDTYPQVNTWRLRDGRYSNPGGLKGRYSVDGNRITFDVPDFGYALKFTFSVDSEGNLHLTPVRPMDPGDAFVWSYKVWRKIR